MLELSQLVRGARVLGLSADGPAKILDVKTHGGSAVQLVFLAELSGQPGTSIVYQADADALELLAEARAWAFDGDGQQFRLALEAERLRPAYLADPQLAVSVSRVAPLPHQLSAVYDEMLPRHPLRFLLADDPGAGKTIMAGLLIKELILRADVERCLIVVPAVLDVQWQDELHDKFGLQFALLGREQIAGARGNAFGEHNLVIARIDMLKQDEQLERLDRLRWDLTVFDEAHKLGATFLPGPNEVKTTARYRLAEVLSERSRHLLLLTATPHRGKHADFELLLRLLDPVRFSGRPREQAPTDLDGAGYRDLMRRMLKENLVDFDGRPLFPDRYAHTIAYTLSDLEAELYDAVTHYVREEMTRADQLAAGGGGEGRRRRAVVGFALTMLQRRLASSPEAILRSLERRRARLAETLLDERKRSVDPTRVATNEDGPARTAQLGLGLDLGVPVKGIKLDLDEFETDLDERPVSETDVIVDRASAARSLADLELEVARLTELEGQARHLREAGVDAKWQQLKTLLSDPRMFSFDGSREKLVIFTEHRDTLEYLRSQVRAVLGGEDQIALIHGGMGRDERHREQARFVGGGSARPEASVLIATDAAGEGINLQVAHLMVNYDLPWNPNRLEQRSGRIHRFGQHRPCHNWNLVARGTREGDVYQTLFEKLNEAREALGGMVFDVLGQLFNDRPLRDLLIEAIRDGDGTVPARAGEDLASLVSLERYRDILDRHALAKVAFGPEELRSVRAERAQAESRRLVPHVVGGFFVEAFREIGGTIEQREPGRFAISVIPHDLRKRARDAALPVADRYGRICFDKDLVRIGRSGTGSSPVSPTSRAVRDAELVTPGHPIFDLTVGLVRERLEPVLQRGTMLADSRPGADAPRALFGVVCEVADEGSDASGPRRPARAELRFVEVGSDGKAADAGSAPHLDYRPLSDDETGLAAPLREAAWLRDAAGAAETFAIEQLLPLQREQLRRERAESVGMAREAIDSRLTAALYQLDDDIASLKQQEFAGRQLKSNVDRKQQEYADLTERRRTRLQELDRQLELALRPPRIVTAALIVPEAMLAELRGDADAVARARATQRIEALAMRETIRHETRSGMLVRDVSTENRGYDLECEDPATGLLRLVEVKGRDHRGESIVLTRNEYLSALNNRGQYVLAIVQIEDDAVVGYHAVTDPLGRTTLDGLPFGQESTVFAISGLIRGLGGGTSIVPDSPLWEE